MDLFDHTLDALLRWPEGSFLGGFRTPAPATDERCESIKLSLITTTLIPWCSHGVEFSADGSKLTTVGKKFGDDVG
jgi:hypothetical protein